MKKNLQILVRHSLFCLFSSYLSSHKSKSTFLHEYSLEVISSALYYKLVTCSESAFTVYVLSYLILSSFGYWPYVSTEM